MNLLAVYPNPRILLKAVSTSSISGHFPMVFSISRGSTVAILSVMMMESCNIPMAWPESEALRFLHPLTRVVSHEFRSAPFLRERPEVASARKTACGLPGPGLIRGTAGPPLANFARPNCQAKFPKPRASQRNSWMTPLSNGVSKKNHQIIYMLTPLQG